MIRIFRSFGMLHIALLTMAVLTLSSCLKDDDNDEVVYPSDAAIVAFSLNDFSRIVTTTSSTGADSTYTAKVTGSKYKFYIDQVNRKIYNADSLPYGSKVARLLCNISSLNSGTVVIKSMASDSLFYYSSTDSIDFSSPRRLSVYSLDGKTHVEYEVTVNVHQEEANVFKWNSLPSQDIFASAQALRMFNLNGKMFVFVSNGFETSIYSCNEDGTGEWTPNVPNINTPVPAEAVDNVVATDKAIYMCVDGNDVDLTEDADRSKVGWLVKYSGDSECTMVDVPVGTRLVAADARTLYAINADGHLVSSSDEGQTWTEEPLDSDASLLPISDISYCRIPSKVNSATENVVIVGSRSAENYYGDLTAMVWSKVVEYAENSRPNTWMYINENDMSEFVMPRLSRPALTCWKGGILAIGGPGIGACDNEGFSRFYYSMDGGIYWRKTTDISLPTGFSATTCTMATDSKNNIWMVCGGSGQVWYGRLSGEESSDQKTFTE